MTLNTCKIFTASKKDILNSYVSLDQGLDSVSLTLQGHLTNLAEGCIVEEGPSLFMAGVMLGYIEEEILSFEAYCQDIGFIRMINPNLKEEQSIQLYPNPSSGELTVKFSVVPESESRVTIFNVAGQQVYHKLIPKGIDQQMIILPHLAEGHYLFKLQSADLSFTYPLIIFR